MILKVNYMYLHKITFNNKNVLDCVVITHCPYFFMSILLGWFLLALSNMLQQKCSPAVLLSQCSHVQLRSGHWKESWVPRPVWLRAKLLERCWHFDAHRLGSTGWRTGRFPGHIAPTLWVWVPLIASEFVLSRDMFFTTLSQIQSFRTAMKDGGIILSEPRRKYVGTWFIF